MEYNITPLKSMIDVNSVVTICYVTFEPNGSGETHNFHELIFVDKGPLNVKLDDEEFSLEEGDALLYPPNVLHTCKPAGKKAGIISFVCNSPYIKQLECSPKTLTNEERKLFFDIIKDGMSLFETAIDGMRIKKDVSEYQLQIVKNRIELLLVSLLNPRRKDDYYRTASAQGDLDDLSEQIYKFLKGNVSSQLNLGILCKTFGVSLTKLKTVFRERYGCGIIEKFIDLKIDRSKDYLRNTNYHISKISDMLGFDSPQYFSYQFKKRTGMTPSEYSRSIEP